MKWTWLGRIGFFFAWIFVTHGVAIVLHEVGGHCLAAKIVGCGCDRIKLTYFGQGLARLTRCSAPLGDRNASIIEWAGLAVTLSVGVVALAFLRRAGLTPLARLLLALFTTRFLLSDLAYATSGGFYEVRDPARTAVILESHGLHVLAWLPPLVLYAAAALYGARAIIDAFREHFGSRSRLHGLKQIVATLGVAELIYIVVNRIEATIRTDMPPTIEVAAAQRWAFSQAAPWIPIHTFPIRRVLLAIAVAAFVAALVRPVRPRESAEDAAPGRIPLRYAMGVAMAALGCAIMITVLMRV